MSARVGRVMLTMVATVLLVAGCSGDGKSGKPSASSTVEAAGPFDQCPVPLEGETAPPPAPNATLVPDLTLPCIGGGVQVQLRKLAKPAVINLWASWCGPCRDELPALENVYQAAGDRLAMIGVVTKDTKPSAQSLADELGVSLPAAYDPEGKLQKGLGKTALPITIFVDASGTLKYVYVGVALTVPKLQELIQQNLGITVEL